MYRAYMGEYLSYPLIFSWFLGVLENIRKEDNLTLENAAKVYLQRLSVIWSSPLLDYYKVVASNQLALPVLVYFMWTQVWPIAELQRIDRESQKIMVENGGKHPLASSDFLYLSIGDRVDGVLSRLSQNIKSRRLKRRRG